MCDAGGCHRSCATEPLAPSSPAVLSRCVYGSVADLKAAWGVRGSRKSPVVRDAGIVTDMLGPVSVTMLLVRMRHGLPLPWRAH